MCPRLEQVSEAGRTVGYGRAGNSQLSCRGEDQKEDEAPLVLGRALAPRLGGIPAGREIGSGVLLVFQIRASLLRDRQNYVVGCSAPVLRTAD